MRYFLILFVFLSSCSNNETNAVHKSVELSEKDSILNKVETNDLKIDAIQSEQTEIKSKIEKKFGKQLDFCTCIHFHDSLNNAAQKELNEQQIEKLLKRWENMEMQCKELVNTKHRTPEERALHEQKVKKCLNQK